MIRLHTPLSRESIRGLNAGDEVLLSGAVLTARDAAHKNISELIRRGKRVPLNLGNGVIYYCGPTPPSAHRPIGSCGPTTSSRMDAFTPDMISLGVIAMIGKGDRSEAVRKAIRKRACVYFIATGGAGALLATKVKSAKAVLFKELGPEAVYKLEVKDFPLIVGIDSKGHNIYDKIGRKKV